MTEKNKAAILVNLFLVAYCVLLFGYIILRAFHLSLTIDEITTVQIATGENWMDLTATANNHFLNTFLIKGALVLFEPSEFVYRLPNVISFLIYMIYAVKLSKLLKPTAPFIIVALLTAIPFLLDFFSLARGYGLSLAFILLSIYFVLKYIGEIKYRYALISIFAGMFAVMANFSSVNYFIPLLLILFFFGTIKKNRNWTKVAGLAIIAGLFLSMIIPVLFQLKNNGQLFFGGRSSFYSDTILSLSKTFSYHILNIALINIVFSVLFFFAIVTSIFSIYQSIRKKTFDMSVVLPILFLLSILSPIAQNIFFDTNFPVERAALLYYPLLLLVITHGITGILKHIQTKLLSVISVLFLLFLTVSLNFNHCYSWRFDAGTKEVFKIITEKHNQYGSKKQIALGINGLFVPSVEYYEQVYEFDTLIKNEINYNCEFDLAIEEFDINYYSNSSNAITQLCEEDAERIISLNLDYYYLHDIEVNELIRHGYVLHIIRHFDYAGTSLITVENKEVRGD